MESPSKNSRWTSSEDCLLVQKYEDCNGNFSQISLFFQNRNQKSLMKRYERLKRKSEQNHMDIKEYVEENNSIPIIDKLEQIFVNEEQNIRILKKISDFSTDDITDSILFDY